MNKRTRGELPKTGTRAREPRPDGTRGTTDDDYGGLLPLESSDSGDGIYYDSPLIDLGDPSELPPDIMDLNGNGDTSESLPFDARRQPRLNGAAPDIGAYEW